MLISDRLQMFKCAIAYIMSEVKNNTHYALVCSEDFSRLGVGAEVLTINML
jgi:hypothetical protein